ncbi:MULTISPECIES: DUF6320 domain-containing protein [Brevibacterium]|jgi:hypothetical protein|uniref:DUF6320 domain-containing protein n=1 Tax=Brevibacterium salitolerans TaxID=1403566 RepID=A0ABN2WTB7_9MICO|nr:DUF6320 domain-containing protein [Brevibacterium sp.]
MSRCPECAVDVEGVWEGCPLCGAQLDGEPVPGPLPDVPLSFSRRRLLTVLFLASLGVIAASFLAQLLFRRGEDSVGTFRSAWLGVASMWLVVLMAVRKRRNVAKGTVYLVVLVSGVCAYWDYLSGWNGWALSWAIPLVCASATAAVLITVRAMRMEVGEHVVYSWLTVLLGLAPLVFLALGWVEDDPVPSLLCGALTLIALALELVRVREMRHELAKRLHL